jgi:thioredoxin 2
MEPNFKGAAAHLAGKARLLKVNADNSETATRLGVRSIPSLILFQGSREVARQLGLMSKDGIVAWVKANATAPTTA